MSVSRKKAVGIGLGGYAALIAGLFMLAILPFVGVLMVLCGMALAICSAGELVHESAAAKLELAGRDSAEPGE